MNLESELKKSTLCKQLDDGELKAIAAIASSRRLRQGEIVFFQGEEATGFFVLLSGRVRIYKSSPDGKEYTLHIIEPGEMFAEAAIFHGSGYPANCMALEDSAAAFLPRDGFVRLIERSPEISMKMIAALSAFLRHLARMVEELSLKEVPARLASYLLTAVEESRSTSITLSTSKTELANLLGTTSETLSRNLKKFRELGLIEVAGRRIRVLDASHLRVIAEGEKI